ncbi:hypothetical protein H70357_20090 [Paenibacillus sp. FSL H7-0357]|nr:hypothetical protein H70357_20090 [Paenibacillus sp. FSL H7-0357]
MIITWKNQIIADVQKLLPQIKQITKTIESAEESDEYDNTDPEEMCLLRSVTSWMTSGVS